MKNLKKVLMQTKEQLKGRKKGLSHFLEILGGMLIVVLIIGAFNNFNYTNIITTFMNGVRGILQGVIDLF